MRNSIMVVSLLMTSVMFAQQTEQSGKALDSIKSAKQTAVDLEMVIVTPFKQSPERQPEVKGNVLFVGKKMKS